MEMSITGVIRPLSRKFLDEADELFDRGAREVFRCYISHLFFASEYGGGLSYRP